MSAFADDEEQGDYLCNRGCGQPAVSDGLCWGDNCVPPPEPLGGSSAADARSEEDAEKVMNLAEVGFRTIAPLITDDVLREVEAKLRGFIVSEQDCRGRTTLRGPSDAACMTAIDVLRAINQSAKLLSSSADALTEEEKNDLPSL